MVRLRTRVKRSVINVFECISFLLNRKRGHLHQVFEQCNSTDDLFNFAAEHIGIGQNRDEFLNFMSYIMEEKPHTICEIGVRAGGTNFMLANAIASCRTIIGIDILLQHVHLLEYFCREGVSQFFVSGDSSDPRTVRKVEKCLGNCFQLDVLFIDGDHSYKGVAKDFYAYQHLVKEGGIIAFHDICMDHRRRFGIDTPNDAGEVYLFWEKIRGNYKSLEFYSSTHQNGSGIGAITWDPSIPLINYLEK